jgi:hypothetical protein
MTDDAKIIRGDFMSPKFSSELSYLSHYFRTELPACFAKYYLEFGHMVGILSNGDYCDQFVDHTGLVCSNARLRYLLNRIQSLTKAEKKATDDYDVDTLIAIKDGKYKFDEC